MKRPLLLVCVILLVAAVPIAARASLQGQHRAKPMQVGHKVTAAYYEGSYGACGKLVGNYAAAKSVPCGTKLTLKRNSKTVTVTILDRCPGCGRNGLDLRKAAFAKLAPTSAGTLHARIIKRVNG